MNGVTARSELEQMLEEHGWTKEPPRFPHSTGEWRHPRMDTEGRNDRWTLEEGYVDGQPALAPILHIFYPGGPDERSTWSNRQPPNKDGLWGMQLFRQPTTALAYMNAALPPSA